MGCFLPKATLSPDFLSRPPLECLVVDDVVTPKFSPFLGDSTQSL